MAETLVNALNTSLTPPNTLTDPYPTLPWLRAENLAY